MDRKELARKIIDAIFDDAEAEGRVLHRDRITGIAEKILMAWEPVPPLMVGHANKDGTISLYRGMSVPVAVPGAIEWFVREPLAGYCSIAIDCQDEPVIWGME